MLVVELIRETCGQEWQLPTHIKAWSSRKKLEWLLQALAPAVDRLYRVYDDSSAARMHLERPDHRSESSTDELFNSSMGFLCACMDFFVLDDVIRAGDVCRLPAIIKRLAPLFIGLTSFHSKYAVECVNLITKLTWVLSERDRIKVMLRAFVNTSAKAGANKSADMQQEINIRTVKTVLKGIGAGKTPKALLRASKAAPAINRMAAVFQEGSGIKPPPSIFSHYKKNQVEDAMTVRQLLEEERPFNITPGRSVNVTVSPNIMSNVNVDLYIEFAMRNADRAISHCDFDLDGDC